jgi:Predicted integral membrane protein (DUF2269)
MTLYFLIKYLHVLGAIVILGTGSGIAFFMLMAGGGRPVDDDVGDLVHRALAAGVARALCHGRVVLGARDLHAEGDAGPRAAGRGKEPAAAGAAILTPDLWIEPLGALVKTGPAIVLMLVALLILDNR